MPGSLRTSQCLGVLAEVSKGGLKKMQHPDSPSPSLKSHCGDHFSVELQLYVVKGNEIMELYTIQCCIRIITYKYKYIRKIKNISIVYAVYAHSIHTDVV